LFGALSHAVIEKVVNIHAKKAVLFSFFE